MFLLLLLVLSYGSLLILLMPATGIGILSAAIAFVFGLGFMIFKKVHQICFWKHKQYRLFLISALIVPYFGLLFYNRWLPSSKMQAIASIFCISIETFLLIASLALSIASAYFICLVLQITRNMQNSFAKNLICSLFAAVITVIAAQIMINIPAFSMGCLKFLLGVMIVSTAILFTFCLLGRIVASVFLGSGIFMIISTVNIYVYRFRNRLFEPVDILSAGTAMNVAENYSLFPIPSRILLCWGIFVTMMIVIFYVQKTDKQILSTKNRLTLFAACIISFASILAYTSNLKTYHWQKEGVSFNGYILDFVSKFKEISAAKPDNYSNILISGIADQYSTNDIINNSPVAPPNIIVIMDEAFSDLSVVGEFSTNTDIIPFISSLKENTIYQI